MTYKEIQIDVIKKYNIKASNICPFGCRTRTHAHVKERMVCKWESKNSMASTFTLLHEVGHIETTKSNMRRCEEEYHATVWAIERCKEYGLEVPNSIYKVYQDYINRELERGLRRGGTNYPKHLTLPR